MSVRPSVHTEQGDTHSTDFLLSLTVTNSCRHLPTLVKTGHTTRRPARIYIISLCNGVPSALQDEAKETVIHLNITL